jgi:Xaa-Pro aminopeptidase
MSTAVAEKAAVAPSIPFDTKLLDRLMDDAGLDVLIANSKHNIQYLLGGHRSIFFDYMDAMGVSRYLPLLVYPKGAPDKAAFIGHRLESHQKEVAPFWTPVSSTNSAGTLDAAQKAVDHVKKSGVKAKRIGVEMAFLPADAATALRGAFKDGEIKDGLFVLERLRAKKRPEELAMLRKASELVVDSMTAVMAKTTPGMTKRELFEALRKDEVNRGLTFEYCLLTTGTSLNRAPSEYKLAKGDIISLDSGANYHGYIGDLCRMAILGEPDAELQDLLGEIEMIQRAAFKSIKPGAMGSVIYGTAEPLVRKSKNHNHMHFLAHGMGLVSHEAPRLAPGGSMGYDPYDTELPLEPGMVISVETTLQHPKRGFIKLEDTVAVTDTGFEIYGEGGRGWNRSGSAPAR